MRRTFDPPRSSWSLRRPSRTLRSRPSLRSLRFMLALGSVALGGAAACATSNDEESSLPPAHDAGTTSVPEDASTSDGAASTDAGVTDAAVPSWCSNAGWCATSLPDSDLTVTDIWPFDDRAFAIAESDTLGTKVLEWTDATGAWAYIDDNSQNALGGGKYSGKIWAPNENEVYFGVAPAFIHHGTRANPSSPWTWESSRLSYEGRDFGPEHDPGRPWHNRHPSAPGVPADRYAALGVWGTSSDDVYAWYANTIFHRKSVDGGAPAWVPEYALTDPAAPDDAFFIFAADGSSSDDIWFAGGRGRYTAGGGAGIHPCTVVIHRTPDEYRRIVDHTVSPTPSNTCRAKAGVQSLKVSVALPGVGTVTAAWTSPGWMMSIASTRPGAAVGIWERKNLASIASEDAGSALLNPVAARSAAGAYNPLLSSIWIHEETAWLSGWGLVLEAENKPDAWTSGKPLLTPEEAASPSGVDGGATYSISSTALNGTPLDLSLLQVRGSSNNNLWAVGPRYALHKKTP